MGVLCLLALLASIALVISGYTKLHTAVPTCYGRVMHPGDVCVARNKDSFGDGMPTPSDTTYQQQLHSLTTEGWTSIGLGVALFAVCAVLMLAWAASGDL